MSMNIAIIVFASGFLLTKSSPTTYGEKSALIQEQAQDDYAHHQDVLRNQNDGPSPSLNGGFNKDGSFGVTFDNNDKNYRDRGYGYEKAYAYSRQTAFFDYLDDKPSLDSKKLVENYGKSDSQDEDLFESVTH